MTLGAASKSLFEIDKPMVLMAKHIPLTKGKFAVVDDSDYAALAQFKWQAHLNGGVWYAQRWVSERPRSHPLGRKKRCILMHRQILEATADREVDHRNHDGLDNRRENLRAATRSGNTANGRPARARKFRGVYPAGRRWCAAISNYPSSVRYLGYFDDPVDAARAYDAAAIEKYGEFATLNFPIGGQP
jgi:hypothetical protein